MIIPPTGDDNSRDRCRRDGALVVRAIIFNNDLTDFPLCPTDTTSGRIRFSWPYRWYWNFIIIVIIIISTILIIITLAHVWRSPGPLTIDSICAAAVVGLRRAVRYLIFLSPCVRNSVTILQHVRENTMWINVAVGVELRYETSIVPPDPSSPWPNTS